MDSSTQRLLNKDVRDRVDDESEYGFALAIPEAPVTQQRLPFLADPTKTHLEHAGR